MSTFLGNIPSILANAFISIWFWINTYSMQLLFLIALIVALLFEIKEDSVLFIDDERKVV